MGLFHRTLFILLMALGVFVDKTAFSQQQQCTSFTTQCACLAPCVWSGGTPGTCLPPSNLQNACDDGTLSGTASLVSSSVQGGSPAIRFNSLINKKLACCMNPYDPLSPSQFKYDCVDNSIGAGAGVNSSFDDIWAGSDPVDSGAQAYGMVLTSGGNGLIAGKPISGFYTLQGARCSEFSEFAGIIHGAKINPSQTTGLQSALSSSSGGACEITAAHYSVTPPNSMMLAVQAVGKRLPYDGVTTNNCEQAARMRRCPILVRAALVATCPRNPLPPLVQTTYMDSMNVIHCMAASVLRIYIRMEQIYEIAGMPSMATFDSVQTAGSSNVLSIANIIQAKIGTTCPGYSTRHSGMCMGCAPGCGGQVCGVCPQGTYSGPGDIQCTSCPPGLTSPAGSTSSMACGHL